jgi:hypothetical protein
MINKHDIERDLKQEIHSGCKYSYTVSSLPTLHSVTKP